MMKRDWVKDCSLIGYERKKIINDKGDLELFNMGQKRVWFPIFWFPGSNHEFKLQQEKWWNWNYKVNVLVS